MAEDSRAELERRLAYLEEYRTNIEPVQRDITEANRATVDFALTGIKSLYLLNGGAIIAVPAFAGVSERLSIDSLGTAIACFAVGLFTAALTNLLAYLSEDALT